MATLYFVGAAGSGKTAVALGLALHLRDRGVAVRYFKPVGNPPGAAGTGGDRDAALMQAVLALPFSPEELAPLTLGSYYLSTYRDHQACRRLVEAAYAKVSSGAGALLIDGAARPWAMAALGLDALSLAREWKATLVYVLRPVNDQSLDEALFLGHCAREMGVRVAGVIFNNVPRVLLAKADGLYREILASQGLETLGIIPHRTELSAPTVAEFYEVLGGEILTGEDKLGSAVEDVLVGAMTPESALAYFRRSANKAVITGGDRTEIALAALETDVAVLILTGGIYPDMKVIVRAAEKGVPVILVHYDTYTVINRLAEVSRVIRPGDEKAISLAKEVVAAHCALDRLISLATEAHEA
ncbi:DRTGG domain protein [Ammonifex degensii KC4]|uniref:DRTGG domain protein n=1 Tax=Ammonifex degensii (strain DSM 10501 / KC4) TaxID=429009 RepID=C9R912_AMMDK|nr:DRTGG domain-containing protein [Ammonifex degensii]ACX52791.1 DRTGG domain protein [Ammonifex degensii KC4]